MNETLLNKARLNVVSLNKALINGAVERHGSSAGGGGEPPEEPDVPDVPVTYILSASASNGVVYASVNGKAVALPYAANAGDVIVLEVTANDGYEFEGWSDGSTDNPRSITMTADVALSATCVVKAVEKEYIQFADPAVEAVLMAKGVSSDGVGITKEDAAAVTSIGTWFKGNTVISSFNEFSGFKGVTSLQFDAFYGCTALTEITLPDNVTTIQEGTSNVGAFQGCVTLKKVIANCVNNIGRAAFKGCSNLEELSIDWAKVTHIGTESLAGCDALTFDFLNLESLTSMSCNALKGLRVRRLNLGKLTNLPTSGSNYVNYGDKSVLEEVVLSDELKLVPAHSFRGYSTLAAINIGGVETIECSAFHSSGIASCNCASIKSIGAYAFASCSELQTIDLGDGVTNISNNAFMSAEAVQYIIVRATTPPSLGTQAMHYQNNCPIYVPDAALEAYKTATNWVSYADRIHPLSEIEDYYVSDALLMHLDGINKGNVDGEWQDLVSGNTFVNHGAIAETDGWRFDGASSYMDSTTLTNYGQTFKNRTFEIVVEFERGNITEVVYMGSSMGYTFGRYVGGKSMIFSTGVDFPTLADDMTSGVRIVSVSSSDIQIVASKINGNNGQVSQIEQFAGNNNFIYLGKRASGNHFKGKIHAIRIHDRILTEEEILYNQRIDNKRFNLGLDIQS